MCTVTYLPIGKTEFYLTSNRDEGTSRAIAIPPKKYKVGNVSVFYPKDPQGNGTWIAVSEKNYTVCLLNGAFKKHIHQPPYRMSRGLVVLDFFKYNDAVEFNKKYDFKGIEPFTMLIICTTDELCFYELRWDGERTYLSHIDEDKPHIWSSATLYSQEVIAQRKSWFIDFLNNNPTFTKEDIIHFHKFGGTGNITNDILMNRDNIVRTVSISMVHRSNKDLYMNYTDVISNETESIRVIK